MVTGDSSKDVIIITVCHHYNIFTIAMYIRHIKVQVIKKEDIYSNGMDMSLCVVNIVINLFCHRNTCINQEQMLYYSFYFAFITIVNLCGCLCVF